MLNIVGRWLMPKAAIHRKFAQMEFWREMMFLALAKNCHELHHYNFFGVL